MTAKKIQIMGNDKIIKMLYDLDNELKLNSSANRNYVRKKIQDIINTIESGARK